MTWWKPWTWGQRTETMSDTISVAKEEKTMTVTAEQAALLTKATGIPCKTPALIEKAVKAVEQLEPEVLAARVGDDADEVLRIAAGGTEMMPAPSDPGPEPEIPQPTEDVDSDDEALTPEQLDQMTKKELKAFCDQHGLKKSGTVEDLSLRISEYLGFTD